MGLEVATYIADLVATNPLSTDAVGQGDDHLRLLKSAMQATFPNFGNRHGRIISGATGYTVLSSDNSAVIEVPVATGATVTHTFSLPALSSITAGFYIEHLSKGPTDFSILVPTGGATIEGAATMTLPPKTYARVYYDGTSWRAHRAPMLGFGTDTDFSTNGGASISGTVFLGATLTVSGSVFVGGALTVSGAAHFKGNVSASGGATFATLAVLTGATSLAGTLTVSGASHFQNTVSIAGAVSTNINVHVGTTLTVSGAARFVSSMSIAGAVHMNTTLSVGGAVTLASTLTVSGSMVLLSGQLKFPATINPSADANTLDDYEEGTWTPAFTFATVGNLSVAYTTQSGLYSKVGDRATVTFAIITSSFTHTTASGNALVTGIPFTPANAGPGQEPGMMSFQGITKAGYGSVSWTIVNASTSTQLIASGSGVARANVLAADMPTGGSVALFGSCVYKA